MVHCRHPLFGTAVLVALLIGIAQHNAVGAADDRPARLEGIQQQSKVKASPSPLPSPAPAPAAIPAVAQPEAEDEESEEEPKAGIPTAVQKAEASDSTSLVVDLTKPQFFSDGPFSAIMPGRPSRSSTPLKALNRSIVEYTFTDGEHGIYHVACLDAKGTWRGDNKRLTDDPEKLYDYLELAEAYGRHGSVKDGAIEFQGHEAREYEIEFSPPKAPGVKLVDKSVMYLLGDKVYWVGCVGSADWINSPAVADFVGSMRVGSTPPDTKEKCTSFPWKPISRVRDAAAFVKKLEDAVYCSKAPHISFIADYPYNVNLVGFQDLGAEKKATFITRQSFHDTFTFYVDKLRGNGWAFQKAPPGTISAKLSLQPRQTARTPTMPPGMTTSAGTQQLLNTFGSAWDYSVEIAFTKQGTATLVAIDWTKETGESRGLRNIHLYSPFRK